MRCSIPFIAAAVSGTMTASAAGQDFRVLVFSKTAGFRHDSIPAGIAAIQSLGAERCFAVETTEDAAQFNPTNLARFRVVVFLCTTGDVLDTGQQLAFEDWFRAGKGWVGVHSATDTEYTWPFYGQLIAGAYFAGHPAIQPATILVESASHPSTAHLSNPWPRTDEWYNFQVNPRPLATILLRLDESTYSGGTMGADHPIAWCLSVEGGRSWYTGGGHTIESYAEPDFRDHIGGGILWAANSSGCDCYANCDGSTGVPQLTANDFQCFLNTFAAADPQANCDGSTGTPLLTANDFQCFLNAYAVGCP